MNVQRGDIIYLRDNAYFAVNGHNGHIERGSRPLLVVSNDKGNRFSNICVVCPLTTNKKRVDLPTHTLVNNGTSLVICEQFFTVNQADVKKIIGHVKTKEMIKVNECLMNSLELW